MEQAIFGAGEASVLKEFFEAIPGVAKVVRGFVGDNSDDPALEEVVSDESGHAEAVLVEYDPALVGFQKLCQSFLMLPEATATKFNWHEHPLIYCTSDSQRFLAEKMSRDVGHKMGTKLKVDIQLAGPFYQNEET